MVPPPWSQLEVPHYWPAEGTGAGAVPSGPPQPPFVEAWLGLRVSPKATRASYSFPTSPSHHFLSCFSFLAPCSHHGTLPICWLQDSSQSFSFSPLTVISHQALRICPPLYLSLSLPPPLYLPVSPFSAFPLSSRPHVQHSGRLAGLPCVHCP